LPQFKAWLESLRAGEFLNDFLEAGYDLPFIAENGFEEEDLRKIIPEKKIGIIRKLLKKQNLDKFYVPEEEEEEEEAEDEDDEEEEGEEDEDED